MCDVARNNAHAKELCLHCTNPPLTSRKQRSRAYNSSRYYAREEDDQGFSTDDAADDESLPLRERFGAAGKSTRAAEAGESMGRVDTGVELTSVSLAAQRRNPREK